MTMKETMTVLAIINESYAYAYKDKTEAQAKAIAQEWYIQFKDMPAQIVMMAVHKAIATNKFIPTIAEIHEKIKDIHGEAMAILLNRIDGYSQQELDGAKAIYAATEKYSGCNLPEPSIFELISNENLRLNEGK